LDHGGLSAGVDPSTIEVGRGRGVSDELLAVLFTTTGEAIAVAHES